jgi:heat shock protein HtpX
MSTFEETNLFAQQESNRRKSRWVVGFFIGFFAWLGFGADLLLYLAATQPAEPAAVWVGFPVVGVALSCMAAGIALYARRTGADKVLWSTGAWRLLNPRTELEIRYQNVVDEMTIAASLPAPQLWIIDDADPNAFATGNSPQTSHIAVTTGLLNTLDRDELQAVIAHEMGHIKNLDTQLMTLLAALVGAVLLMRDGVGRTMRNMLRFGGGRSGGGRRGGKGNGGVAPVIAILLVVWIISWVIAPIVLQIITMNVSRRREYLADAMAAQFTRNPLALAAALEKIHAHHTPTTAIKSGVAHLCIADPLGRRLDDREGAFADLFATHPPMALRISKLKAMGFQALKRAGGYPATSV